MAGYNQETWQSREGGNSNPATGKGDDADPTGSVLQPAQQETRYNPDQSMFENIAL